MKARPIYRWIAGVVAGLCLAAASTVTAQPPDGVAGPGRGGPPDPEALFQRMDKNSDGQLSQDEVPGPAWNRLSRADADGDGIVTKDEMKSVMKSRREELARGRGAGPAAKSEPGGDRESAESASPPSGRRGGRGAGFGPGRGLGPGFGSGFGPGFGPGGGPFFGMRGSPGPRGGFGPGAGGPPQGPADADAAGEQAAQEKPVPKERAKADGPRRGGKGGSAGRDQVGQQGRRGRDAGKGPGARPEKSMAQRAGKGKGKGKGPRGEMAARGGRGAWQGRGPRGMAYQQRFGRGPGQFARGPHGPRFGQQGWQGGGPSYRAWWNRGPQRGWAAGPRGKRPFGPPNHRGPGFSQRGPRGGMHGYSYYQRETVRAMHFGKPGPMMRGQGRGDHPGGGSPWMAPAARFGTGPQKHWPQKHWPQINGPRHMQQSWASPPWANAGRRAWQQRGDRPGPRHDSDRGRPRADGDGPRDAGPSDRGPQQRGPRPGRAERPPRDGAPGPVSARESDTQGDV